MGGMLAAAGIVVSAGIGEGIFPISRAGAALVDVESEEMVAAYGGLHRKTVNFRVHKYPSHHGIETDNAVEAGMGAVPSDGGVGGGHFVE